MNNNPSNTPIQNLKHSQISMAFPMKVMAPWWLRKWARRRSPRHRWCDRSPGDGNGKRRLRGACAWWGNSNQNHRKMGIEGKTWWFYGIYYSWFENEVHHQIIILMGNMVINHEFLGYPVLKQTQMVISPTKNGDFLWKIGICSWCTWLGWFLGWSGGHNELVNGWN